MKLKAHEFRSMRHLAGLTQEQAAKLLEVTLRTVCRWEAGDTHIGTLEAEEIKRRLSAAREAAAKAIQ